MKKRSAYLTSGLCPWYLIFLNFIFYRRIGLQSERSRDREAASKFIRVSDHLTSVDPTKSRLLY